MVNGHDEKKYKETIKYIAFRSIEDQNFGRTKLNKILFYCDFVAYRDLGHSITEDGYIKQNFGPVPTHGRKVTKALIDAGEIREINIPSGMFDQKKIVTLTDCDLDVFSPQEVSLIDSIIDRLWDESATSVSELSHRFIGWQLAGMGENIPYETVLLHEAEVTEDDMVYAEQVAGEIAEWPVA